MNEIKELYLSKITGLSDTMFKGIMYTRKRVLSGLLDTCFQRAMGDFKYLNTELSVSKFIEKGRRLDLYLEETDLYVDIEVTNNYGVYIINRNMGFEFKMYCDTVVKGDEYNLYKSVSALQLIGGKTDSENRRDYYLRDESGKVLSEKLLYSEIYVDNYVRIDEDYVFKITGLKKEDI